MCNQTHDDEVTTLKLYEVAIADERYHRDVFQGRLSYHTNIVLLTLGAVIAGVIESDDPGVLRFLGLLLVAVAVLSLLTPNMIRRIYDHFIERLAVRERLEVAMGLRAPADAAPPSVKPATPPPALGADPLYRKTWIPGPGTWGYFRRMELMFQLVGWTAFIAGVLLVAVPQTVREGPGAPVATQSR